VRLTPTFLTAAIPAATLAPSLAQVPEVIRKDAYGRPVKVKLTGKYDDCIKGGLRMHYTPDAVKRYCDSRPGLRK
jgi:hypothetical protein